MMAFFDSKHAYLSHFREYITGNEIVPHPLNIRQ
jgi:hypothetical protein